MTEEEPAADKAGRTHRIPPAPAWRVRDGRGIGGLPVLRELADALAVVLWRALRDVELWTTTPERRRERARLWKRARPAARARYLDAREQAPELRRALATFRLRLLAPHLVDRRRLAGACIHVARWAEARSMVETAAHFAEAAAYVLPENPRNAYHAGRLCRRVALLARAETWYRRAFHLAAAVKMAAEDPHTSREISVLALLGYGAVLKAQGLHDEARTWTERAGTRAMRLGRRHEAAKASHDLAAIEAEAGDLDAVIAHVDQALTLYPRDAERLPYLVHDCAFYLIRLRLYTYAVPLLVRLVSVIERPEEQVLVYGSLARAAGAARRRERYELAERHVLELAQTYQEHAAAAFVHLAEGARAFEEWEKAADYADTAAEIAAARGDELIRRDAEELGELIDARTPIPQEEEPPAPEAVALLVRRVRAKLQSWRPRGAPADQLPEPNV